MSHARGRHGGARHPAGREHSSPAQRTRATRRRSHRESEIRAFRGQRRRNATAATGASPRASPAPSAELARDRARAAARNCSSLRLAGDAIQPRAGARALRGRRSRDHRPRLAQARSNCRLRPRDRNAVPAGTAACRAGSRCASAWSTSSTTTARSSGFATATCCCAATTAPANPRCCRSRCRSCFDAQLKPSRVEPDGDRGQEDGVEPAARAATSGAWATPGSSSAAWATTASRSTSRWAAACRPRRRGRRSTAGSSSSKAGASARTCGSPVRSASCSRKERLREALGDRGQVFDTAPAYRRAVDERLFQLGDGALLPR